MPQHAYHGFYTPNILVNHLAFFRGVSLSYMVFLNFETNHFIQLMYSYLGGRDTKVNKCVTYWLIWNIPWKAEWGLNKGFGAKFWEVYKIKGQTPEEDQRVTMAKISILLWIIRYVIMTCILILVAFHHWIVVTTFCWLPSINKSMDQK